MKDINMFNEEEIQFDDLVEEIAEIEELELEELELDNVEIDLDDLSSVVKTIDNSEEMRQSKMDAIAEILEHRNKLIYPEDIAEILEENLLPDYVFVSNMAEQGAIYEISTFSLQTYKHNEKSFFLALKDFFKHEFNKSICFMTLSFLEERTETGGAGKGFTKTEVKEEMAISKSIIIDSLSRVYSVVIDPREKSGVFKMDKNRKYAYNMFSNPKVRQHYMEYAEKNKSTLSFEEHFDFSKYPTWEILLMNLTNPEHNKMHYQTGDKSEINPFVHFIKFLNFSFTNTEKAILMPIFVSEMQGAGKGVMMKFLYSYVFGDEYYTSINNKTLLGGFNAILQNKMFVCYDEGQVDNKDFTKVGAAIKSIASEDSMIIEKKGEDQITMDSLFNIILHTNRKRCIPLDTTDRRAWVFQTHNRMLEERVTKEFGYKSVAAFIQDLQDERDEFLKALFSYDFDYSELVGRPIMSEAKKAMISASNTMTDVAVSLLKGCDENGVREFFTDIYDENQIQIEDIILDMKAGFITAKNCKFMYNLLRNEMDKGMKQASFWNIHISQSSPKVYFDKEKGANSSFNCRRIENGKFNQEAFDKRVNEIKGNNSLNF